MTAESFTPWRWTAISLNVVIVLALAALQIVLTVRVLTVIADVEARTGLTADNDWGQRGVAMGGFVVVVALLLAAISVRLLLRTRVSGFITHSVLWLLMLGVLAVVPLQDEAETVRVILQSMCCVGLAFGIALSVAVMRSSRSARSQSH